MTWLLGRISPMMFLIGFLTACGCACWVMLRDEHKERTRAAIALDERRIAELQHVIGPLCAIVDPRQSVERTDAMAESSRTDPDAVAFARDVASRLPVNVTDVELEVAAQ